MNLMAIPIALVLFFTVTEMLILQHQGRNEVFTWKNTISNLNSGHAVLLFFRGLEVAVFAWISTHFSLPVLSSLPTVAQWIFAIIAWDFCFYVLHYIHHKIGLLWAVHEVHHEGKYFNISLATRNSWYSSLSSIPFFIWMAFLGLPAEIFLVVSTGHYAVQLFNHNAITPKLGWLEYVLVTPSHHRIHHGQERIYCNSNYGGSFIIWDKLFGTFQKEQAGIPLVIGTRNPTPSDNPFHSNHDTLLRWLKLPTSKPARSRFTAPNWLIATGGIILSLIAIIHLAGDGVLPHWQYYTLLIGLPLATIALGGISEGQYWSIGAWTVTAILTTYLVLGVFSWSQWYWVTLCYLLLLHSLITVFISIRNTAL